MEVLDEIFFKFMDKYFVTKWVSSGYWKKKPGL